MAISDEPSKEHICTYLNRLLRKILAGCQRLTSVTLATWRAEIRKKSWFEASLGKKLGRPPPHVNQ
jgi:hypothetical protein